MTPARFLDVCRADAWVLTPRLEAMLDGDDFRNGVWGCMSPHVAPEQHAFIVSLMRREMAYRNRLWNGMVEDDGDRHEHICRCAFLLYRLGRPDDVFLLWQAKHLDMDVGCSLGVEYFVGAGVDATLAFLAQCDAPEAGEIAAYVGEAFVTDDAMQEQSGWEREQFQYHWPT